MPLESATYINGLNVSNPTGADTKAEGDDHIRLIKSAVKSTFPSLTGAVTADQNELNILDGATLSTAELNLLDGVTASTAELNLLDGVTATTTEINYVDGVTSPIQAQFSGKADITGETYTGTHDFTGATAVKAPTKAPGSTGTDVATVDYANALAFSSALPGLAGNALKTLRVNAGETSAEWAQGLPIAAGHEGKALALDGAAVTKWANAPHSWANWQLITSNGGTFTVPDLVNEIRAYVFARGGNGALANGGGGGGGGGCTYGTIPCKPGDVFTFDNTSGAVLKKGATAYLSASNGSNGSGTTGGAGGTVGTVGSGLGIAGSGAYAGGAGGDGNAGAYVGGGGGSSGSPLGTGQAGGATASSNGGGGWGSAGNEYGGGGVGSAVATQYTLSGAYAVNNEAAGRDWSNAFTEPLLLLCNAASPVHAFGRLAVTQLGPLNAGPGTGGGRTNTGSSYGGGGGLGGGGGAGMGAGYNGGFGGFGGGGGSGGAGSSNTSIGGNGGYGGGGAGSANAGTGNRGAGGAAAVLIFWG
jgi:hypothetical protein